MCALSQVKSDTVKSLIPAANIGVSHFPESPHSSTVRSLPDKALHRHSQNSTSDSPQGLVTSQSEGVSQGMQRQLPGSSGRQDGASNGSSASSELENREAQQKLVQRKGEPMLRRVQSKHHFQLSSLKT